MLDFSLCSIQQLSVHGTGNKQNGEALILSKQTQPALEEEMEGYLLKYFLKPFHSEAFYHLTNSNEQPELNTVYQYTKEIFERPESFHIQSIYLAKHLYETALHPKILGGDFYVCSFQGIQYNGQLVDAVGLFKSESRDHFIQLKRQGQGFDLQVEAGVPIDKLDKGCIILNTEAEKGFKVCVVDRTNRGAEAAYWKDQYLCIKPCGDAFHLTQNVMNVTKDFLTKQITQEFEVSKADQIDLLNRSVKYFKENEVFKEEEFSQTVFEGNEGLITSFKDFKDQMSKEYELEIKDGFDISDQAVKKQARVFKSVLKLDKNFHIYIHGNRNMIEKGVDHDGRKFYKIYYNEEQ